MNAIVGSSFVVLLALAVGGVPVAPINKDQTQKWYDLSGSELQVVTKHLKDLGSPDSITSDGLLSINFGKSAPLATNDDGTIAFNVYRRVSPIGVSHVLLTPATGDPQTPPRPFQFPPAAHLSTKEAPASATETDEPAFVFPEDTKYYRGTPVFKLEALGQVALRVTDVKKLMAHRDLA